jgi:predicted NUDIX family NTP pyrophosphohydrolase
LLLCIQESAAENTPGQANAGASMAKQSAGILLYRRTQSGPEVLLVHPGGPFWAKRDEGAWSIPKGLCEPGEDPLLAARREFAEETGFAPQGEPIALGTFRQSPGKDITIWALEGDFEPAQLQSNSFRMEWPPQSGRFEEFPEVDRAAWMAPEEALKKIVKGQAPVLAALMRRLEAD